MPEILIDSFELRLVGYSDNAERGYAIPIFGTSHQANTVYTACCHPSGDHKGNITAFQQCSSQGVIPIYDEDAPNRKIGDKWIDVFVWDENIYYGSPTELWEKISSSIKLFRRESPVILLDLAINAEIHPLNNYIRGARQFVQRHFGKTQASEWLSSVIRREVVLAVRRSVVSSGTTNDSELIERFVDVSSYTDNSFVVRIDDTLSSTIDQFKILDSVEFVVRAKSALMVDIYLNKSRDFEIRDQILKKFGPPILEEQIFRDKNFTSIYNAVLFDLRVADIDVDYDGESFNELIVDVTGDVMLVHYTKALADMSPSEAVRTLAPIARKILKNRIARTTRQTSSERRFNSEMKLLSEGSSDSDLSNLADIESARKRISHDSKLLILFEHLLSGNDNVQDIAKSMDLTTRTVINLRKNLLNILRS